MAAGLDAKSAQEDRRLVEEALGGSQRAFYDLVQRYERPVFSVILRMVRDRALAEDLAQETFLKAFRSLASYDRQRKLSSWLFTIAHNAAIDYLRRKRLATVPLEAEADRLGPVDRAAAPASEGPERVALRSDLLRAFEAALAELRPDHAEVLVLRFQEGMAYDEIAEVMGLPLGTVKTHLHRARKALAARLEELGVYERGDRR